MKITREEFRKLGNCPDRKDYIKEKQPLVLHVFTNTIYFKNSSHSIDWGCQPEGNDLDDMFLRAINAACNVEFEFEDEEET